MDQTDFGEDISVHECVKDYAAKFRIMFETKINGKSNKKRFNFAHNYIKGNNDDNNTPKSDVEGPPFYNWGLLSILDVSLSLLKNEVNESYFQKFKQVQEFCKYFTKKSSNGNHDGASFRWLRVSDLPYELTSAQRFAEAVLEQKTHSKSMHATNGIKDKKTEIMRKKRNILLLGLLDYATYLNMPLQTKYRKSLSYIKSGYGTLSDEPCFLNLSDNIENKLLCEAINALDNVHGFVRCVLASLGRAVGFDPLSLKFAVNDIDSKLIYFLVPNERVVNLSTELQLTDYQHLKYYDLVNGSFGEYFGSRPFRTIISNSATECSYNNLIYIDSDIKLSSILSCFWFKVLSRYEKVFPQQSSILECCFRDVLNEIISLTTDALADVILTEIDQGEMYNRAVSLYVRDLFQNTPNLTMNISENELLEVQLINCVELKNSFREIVWKCEVLQHLAEIFLMTAQNIQRNNEVEKMEEILLNCLNNGIVYDYLNHFFSKLNEDENLLNINEVPKNLEDENLSIFDDFSDMDEVEDSMPIEEAYNVIDTLYLIYELCHLFASCMLKYSKRVVMVQENKISEYKSDKFVDCGYRCQFRNTNPSLFAHSDGSYTFGGNFDTCHYIYQFSENSFHTAFPKLPLLDLIKNYANAEKFKFSSKSKAKRQLIHIERDKKDLVNIEKLVNTLIDILLQGYANDPSTFIVKIKDIMCSNNDVRNEKEKVKIVFESLLWSFDMYRIPLFQQPYTCDENFFMFLNTKFTQIFNRFVDTTMAIKFATILAKFISAKAAHLDEELFEELDAWYQSEIDKDFYQNNIGTEV